MFFLCVWGLVQIALMPRPLDSFSMLLAVLTDYVLGLLSSLHFVGCGAQICFGPLWISNPWVEFPSVHAGSWLLLCLGLSAIVFIVSL